MYSYIPAKKSCLLSSSCLPSPTQVHTLSENSWPQAQPHPLPRSAISKPGSELRAPPHLPVAYTLLLASIHRVATIQRACRIDSEYNTHYIGQATPNAELLTLTVDTCVTFSDVYNHF